MCGISAISLKKGLTQNQKEKVLLKLKILAIYNDSRGGDGCGVYMNNTIYKGHFDDKKSADTKRFYNFIAQPDWQMPNLKSNSAIIHSRKSSWGKDSAKNNHPFYIETGDVEKDIVFVHNGTIKEVYNLCQKYNLKYADYDVDSEVLATIIANDGYEVLSNYKGDAACIWVHPNNPEELYVYHGKSVKTRNAEAVEERPMFFLEAKEGTYFSSMKEPLYAIKEPNEKVNTLQWNRVYRVTNGVFSAELYTANRDTINIETTYPVKTHTPIKNYATRHNYEDYEELFPEDKNKDYSHFPQGALNIELETLPARALKTIGKNSVVYFHKNRYYHEGKLMDGSYFIDKKGVIYDKKFANNNEHFFIEGVLLKSEENYKKLVHERANDTSSFFRHPEWSFKFYMAEYTEMPITNVGNQGSALQTSRYTYVQGKWPVQDQTYAPKWSNRQYKYSKGNLIEISSSLPEEKNNIFIVKQESNISTPRKEIKNLETAAFDAVFSDWGNAMDLLSLSHILCIKEYIKDTWSEDMLEPDDIQLGDMARSVVQTAVAKKLTIREVLKDTKQNIDKMYIIIRSVEDDLENVEDIDRTAPEEKKALVTAEETKEDEEDEALIDEALKKFEEEKENEEVEGKLEDIINLMKELQGDSEDLSTLVGNELAQDSAEVIKRGIDQMRTNLNSTFDTHNKSKLNLELTKI